MTALAPAQRFHFTVDDLERMPPVLGARYELIDGELHVSTAPHYNHQVVCAALVLALGRWGELFHPGDAVPGPGLVFSERDAVIPDFVWVPRDRRAEVVGADGKLRAAPDLVVEVLSPGGVNVARDREDKLNLYSRRGVPEYWIVDWRLRRVDVYRQDGAALAPVASLEAGDVLTSPRLPGFALPLSDLFADLVP